MTMELYSIRDIAANKFFMPQMEYNDTTITRWFGDLINNNPGSMNYKPSDYDLFHVGHFDTAKGVVEPVTPIRLVCTGVDVFGK